MILAAERRVGSDTRLARKLAWPLRLPRSEAWKLVLLTGFLTGIADFVTASDIWFGPIYLLVICLAAWSLGWREAVGAIFGCLATALLANGMQLHVYSGSTSAWNFAVRLVTVASIIFLLHTVRQMYAMEWRLSRTDPLTGALNRKAFFEVTVDRTNARNWSVLLYADLDGFKALNDTVGHTIGDEYLARFVRQVTSSIRQDDILARLGGDEFAIYLDVSSELAAKRLAVRLHKAMNAVQLPSGTTLNCSVGALILKPGRRSIDQEVRSADFLMYEAKGIGSSLVVATAHHQGETSSLQHHWDLTPDGSPIETGPAVLAPAGAVPFRRSGDLRKVA